MAFQLPDNEARELASMKVRGQWDILKAIADRYIREQTEAAIEGDTKAGTYVSGVKDFFKQLEWGIQGFNDKHQPSGGGDGSIL